MSIVLTCYIGIEQHNTYSVFNGNLINYDWKKVRSNPLCDTTTYAHEMRQNKHILHFKENGMETGSLNSLAKKNPHEYVNRVAFFAVHRFNCAWCHKFKMTHPVLQSGSGK